jgi:hypothetical protein
VRLISFVELIYLYWGLDVAKHALPMDDTMALYWYNKAINDAVQEDRKRILTALRVLQCPADKIEHNCDSWHSSNRPPAPSDIIMIVEDEYFTAWEDLLFEDYE